MIRQIPLPPEEQAFLADLSAQSETALRFRLRLLFAKGWSLSTLGDALTPPRPRATVHYWVKTVSTAAIPHSDPVWTTPLPTPAFPSDTAISELTGRPTKIRSVSPDVPEQFVTLLPQIAAQARRYRGKTPSNNIYAVANRQFTQICKDLHALGVPSAKIAEAAHISYRAVARRVAK